MQANKLDSIEIEVMWSVRATPEAIYDRWLDHRLTDPHDSVPRGRC
jgi:hypothetical protein